MTTSKPTNFVSSIVYKCAGNSCTLKNRCSCRRKGTICGPKCHRGRKCFNASKVLPGTSEIVIDSDSSRDEDDGKTESDNWWIQQEQLSLTDEKQLLGGQWLSDKHISAAQNMMRKQFPDMDGLFSPLVGTSTIGFNPVQRSAVQIHNNERMHWLTSSAGITGRGEVDIFDSLSGRLLWTPLCRQLADIYRLLADDDGVIKVNIKPVQQQRFQEGNCGPFAIAFAASLCHGIDPSTITFPERSLRPHIHHAFESGKIDPFPQTSRCGRRATAVQMKISIYCICYRHKK